MAVDFIPNPTPSQSTKKPGYDYYIPEEPPKKKPEPAQEYAYQNLPSPELHLKLSEEEQQLFREMKQLEEDKLRFSLEKEAFKSEKEPQPEPKKQRGRPKKD